MMSLQSKIHPGLYLFLFIGTVLISLWSVYADPIINIDGILYIRAAKALALGDIQSALAFYKWPFYPYLIFLTHRMSGFDLVVSAHVLNALFSFLTAVVFLLAIAELGGTRRTLIIGALVIVFFPGLNELRSFIIRDHAYIASYLLSFLLFLRALNARSVKLLLAAVAAMGIATLFRIEGFIFLLVMPLFYLYVRQVNGDKKRLLTLAGTVVIICLFVVVFGWWLYVPEHSSDTARFTIQNVKQGWIGAGEHLGEKITVLKDEVLNTSSSSIARLMYLWVALGIMVAHVLIILGLPYAILCGYALKKRIVFPRQVSMKPWKWFVYINVVILVFFTLTRFFLTDRYPIPLAVMLLLAVPFALDQIYQKWRSVEVRTFHTYALYGFLLLVIIASCIEGFTSYSNKHYLRESGLWLDKNIPSHYKLFTNSPIVGFYSSQYADYLKVVEDRRVLLASLYRGEWIHYDYLALKIAPDPEFEKHLKNTLWLVPEKVFTNERNRQVRIYNVKKYRERENQ